VIDLIDDQLLGSVLRGSPPARRGASIYTTGYFYVRLCQAVLGSSAAAGVLSAPFASLPGELRARAIRALLELPDEIGLVSLRELAPVIGQLRARHDLNILGMEVLAAAVHLQADVYLSAPSPRLEESLRREARSVQILA
jgi:hypothetical protein